MGKSHSSVYVFSQVIVKVSKTCKNCCPTWSRQSYIYQAKYNPAQSKIRDTLDNIKMELLTYLHEVHSE